MGKTIICEDCKKRKAVVKYSDEPIFALTHGWGVTNICRQCYIIRMENNIKQTNNGIKEQKKLIRREK